ncbi:zinc-binding dehydrogenase [Candidatus Latescibacteria bacterium]|nr:zinc-binding dehydrogenase [Candidatus Latescibacterota bacterium]
MSLYKGLLNEGFALPHCEKHFHDHDETWLILKGSGTGYWIDHDGHREEFALEQDDVWMIPAGYEHGSEGLPDTGKNSDDFTIAVLDGTMPPGSHDKGHYYVEKEEYIPSFKLIKTPSNRYGQPLDLPAQMQGFRFRELGRAEIFSEDTPTCSDGQLLCRTLYSGLTNGTERNVMMGGNYGGDFPNSCGYQSVGEVLSLGAGVEGYALGDVVFCGEHLKHRQYFSAPAGRQELVVKLPCNVDRQHAALLGIASVAMHDVRRAQTHIGERILVIGAGLVGQFTAQIARLSGAVVTVCDLDAERLEVAAKLGAHSVLIPDADWANVAAAGPFDCAIEDSGAPILDHVVGSRLQPYILKQRGRVVMIAGRDRVDYPFNFGQMAELCILHASHFSADDLRETCRLLSEGSLQIGPVVRDLIPFNEMQGVYDRLRDDPASLLGVVFDWQ